MLKILDETIYANSKTWSPVANKGKSWDKSNDDFFPIVRWLEKYYSMGMFNFWMLISKATQSEILKQQMNLKNLIV